LEASLVNTRGTENSPELFGDPPAGVVAGAAVLRA